MIKTFAVAPAHLLTSLAAADTKKTAPPPPPPAEKKPDDGKKPTQKPVEKQPPKSNALGGDEIGLKPTGNGSGSQTPPAKLPKK